MNEPMIHEILYHMKHTYFFIIQNIVYYVICDLRLCIVGNLLNDSYSIESKLVLFLLPEIYMAAARVWASPFS